MTAMPRVAAELPTVAVVIDNYNYARYVAEAVRSALGQTLPPAEVIVVDDGSTDASREVIATFGDAVRAVSKDNGGQAAGPNARPARSTPGGGLFLHPR